MDFTPSFYPIYVSESLKFRISINSFNLFVYHCQLLVVKNLEQIQQASDLK